MSYATDNVKSIMRGDNWDLDGVQSMSKIKPKRGVCRIEVQIAPGRWVSITAGDYWFGGDYPDSLHIALQKARYRLSDRRRGDPQREYRLRTVLGEDN